MPLFRVSLPVVAIFQLAALFARSLAELSLRRRGVDAALAGDLSYLLVPAILLVLMFPYLGRCRRPLALLLAPRRLTPAVAAASLVVGLALRACYWAALTFLIGIGAVRSDDPRAPAGPILAFACPPPAVLLPGLLVTACVVPLVEEIMHRGFVLHRLLSRGRCIAVTGSALYFALLHRSDTYVAPFLAGLVFALQALRHRTLWPSVIAHAAYNVAAVFDWDCLMLVWNPAPGDPLLRRLTWLSAPAAATAYALALWLGCHRSAGTQNAPSRSPAARGTPVTGPPPPVR